MLQNWTDLGKVRKLLDVFGGIVEEVADVWEQNYPWTGFHNKVSGESRITGTFRRNPRKLLSPNLVHDLTSIREY